MKEQKYKVIRTDSVHLEALLNRFHTEPEYYFYDVFTITSDADGLYTIILERRSGL